MQQGDPLSPYLFIACMEYFSRMFALASLSPEFCFHPKCAPLGISHLAFADDVLLVPQGDRSSVHVLLQQLQIFGQTSGLNMNVDKCSIYFGGVRENLKQVIL